VKSIVTVLHPAHDTERAAAAHAPTPAQAYDTRALRANLALPSIFRTIFMRALTAAEIIRLLDLKPHPEGGHFRETFRDARTENGRAASTAIYFLLARGERSHWHRVDAVEVWHYHAGAPLVLEMAAGEQGPVRRMKLGPDLAMGERPQGVVPAGHWQAAESLGDWTLVGCTVAPAFEFSKFELAPQGWKPT
jgi:predicted cupin superfamily sugar epimerase